MILKTHFSKREGRTPETREQKPSRESLRSKTPTGFDPTIKTASMLGLEASPDKESKPSLEQATTSNQGPSELELALAHEVGTKSKNILEILICSVEMSVGRFR